MRRGATPTITFTVDDYDLSYATHVWVTLEQGSTQVVRKWYRYPDYEDEDVENDGITISDQNVIIQLTQEETLSFATGKVKAQLKFKEDDYDDDDSDYDTVTVTAVVKLTVEEGINEDVM